MLAATLVATLAAGAGDAAQGLAAPPGLAVVPADPQQAARPERFTVHLVPSTDPATELTGAAGEPLRLEAGVYRYWLEGDGLITPDNDAPIVWGGDGASLTVRVPLVPAGRVRLVAGSRSEGCEVRLLSLPRTVPRPPSVRRAPGIFSRRQPCAGGGPVVVAMPAGRSTAALYDRVTASYVALAPPFSVPAGGEVGVQLHPPAHDVAQLLVQVPFGDAPEDRRACTSGLAAVWRNGAAALPADEVVCGANRAFALWFALPPGSGHVELQSRSRIGSSEPAVLRGGRVTELSLALRPRPALEITWDLPAELVEETASLRVHVERSRGWEMVAERRIARPAGRWRLADLDPGRYRVVLAAGPWRFPETAMLAAGEEGVVHFRPTALHVTGTVYSGRTPTVARVRFLLGEDRAAEVTSDEEGTYHVVLFEPGYYVVEVEVEDRPGSWYPVAPEAPIETHTELDLHVPAGRVEVFTHTRDGAPAPGVRVGVVAESSDGGTRAFKVVTGRDGRIALPPMDPGVIRVTVSDPRFEGDEVLAEVSDAADGDVKVVDVVVRRRDRGLEIKAVRADGTPAASATLLVMPPKGAGLPETVEPASPEGSWTLPPELAGRQAVIVEPPAPLAVVQVPETGSREPATVRLAPPRPPVCLRLLDAASLPAPVPIVRMLLIVGGVRLPGTVLQGLGVLSPGGDGTWQLGCDPGAGSLILAWLAAPGLDAQAAAGALDFRAVPLVPAAGGCVPVDVVEP